MSLNPGETLGPYQVAALLGQGGMATVYKAYHAALDRYVAIKVLHPGFKEDPNFQARFQREARVVARLEHPNIVPVYDFAEHNGAPYLVMKFIEGDTLKARLQQGPLPLGEVLRCIETLAAALDFAHRQGVLHRDLKPSNVMLAADGTIYLADFGLARIAAAGESTLSADSMVGTPQYMSPEQARGEMTLDAATDLYSLGVVIYELLVGRAPFLADTPLAVIHDQIYTPPPSPRSLNPAVPEAAVPLLQKALAKDRAARYQSAGELAAAFHEALAPLAAAGAVVGGAALAAATVVRPMPASPTPAGATRVRPEAPAPAHPARPSAGWRLVWWQIALGGGLAIVLCLGAAALGRQLVGRNAARATSAPTQAPAATEGLSTAPPAATAPEGTAPAGVDGLLEAAETALAEGNLDLALLYLDQAVAIDPADTATLVRAGDVLLADNRPFAAIERYYSPAASLERSNPTAAALALQAHVSLAYYVLAADERSEAFLVEQAEQNPGVILPTLALHRYGIFFNEGAGIIEALEPLLEDNPDHEGALLLAGDYYLSRGENAMATRFYQRVRDLPRPGNAARRDWSEMEAACNLDKIRRLRSAATLEATCESLSLLLTGR